MAYQDGNAALTSGVQDYTIVFPSQFTTVPETVLAMVENTSGDPVKLMIRALVTAVNDQEFSVHLDTAPNTDNYRLSWLAADAATVIQMIGFTGRRLSQFPVVAGIEDSDLIPMVRTEGLPYTGLLTGEQLRQAFVRQVAPPASSAAAGQLGDFAIAPDTLFTWVYFHNGVQWVVSKFSQDFDDATVPTATRKAVVSLAAGQKTPVITFATPFVGDPPVITALQVYNLSGDTVLRLHGMPTAVTVAGFTLNLSAAPDTTSYKLFYRAEQI
jgi:hypothetical protein